MRRLAPRLILAICLACATDPVEPPKAGNVTRAWELTKCEYRDPTDPARVVELIAAGWSIKLYINDNHAFLYPATPPGGQPQDLAGTWRIQGSKLLLAPTGYGYEWSFSARVHEESMTLRGASAEYDFDSDGTPEPATWNMAMRN